jgi:porin
MNAPLPGRSKDVFGVGYFHNELADGFKDIVGPLLSFASGTDISIEDTEGFEAYYKAQLAPWFAVTGDVQVITETVSSEDTKVVTGVRAKVTF